MASRPRRPLTPQDLDLLTHYLSAQQEPLALAQACGFTIPELIAWRKRPEIEKTIADYTALADETFKFAAASARKLLIAKLSELVAETPDPVERRRTAQSLLRAINPPRPPRDSTSPSSRSSSSTSSSPSSSTPDDRPHRTRVDDLLDSLTGPDGKIDPAKLTALSKHIEREDDAEDDAELDADADHTSDDDDESDEDEDQDQAEEEDDRPSPQSFDQAAALRPYETPQRLPEGLEELPKPSKDLTHVQVINTCLNALKNNDQPTPDAGIKTVFNFASTHNYVSIRRAHYDDFAAVFHRGPHQHLLNHDSYTIPPQVATGGYFGPHCCIHWWHVFVTKAGEEVEFEIGVCKIDNEPDIPLHIATLNPPYSSRPFRPRPP